MSNQIKCPFCGFTSHFTSSDGKTCAYICEKCKRVFYVKISEKR